MGMAKDTKTKIYDKYEKYAPKNITLAQFAKMIKRDPKLLDDLNGEFSTYNIELARALKKLNPEQDKSKDKFRNTLKKSLNDTAMEQRAKEIAKIYEDIICSNEEILTAAWTFESLSNKQKLELAVNIVSAMNKYFNIDQTINIDYINEVHNPSFSERIRDFARNFMESKWSHIEESSSNEGVYRNYWSEIVLKQHINFENFIDTLSHEYEHFIDHRFPNLGLLGAQIANYGDKVYASSKYSYSEYRKNPTEISSFKLSDIVRKNITRILQEQIEKKPDLYIKTLQTTIKKLRAEFAAQKFKIQRHNFSEEKFNETKNQYEKLRQRLRDERHTGFYYLPEEEQNKIWEEVDKDPRLAELNNKIDQLIALKEQIRKEHFTGFYDLSKEEQDKIWDEIDQDPQIADLSDLMNKENEQITQILSEQYPDFYDLSKEEQDKIWDEIYQDPYVVEIQAKIDKKFDIRYKLRKKLYPDFYDLSEEQISQTIEIVHKDPRVVKLDDEVSNLYTIRTQIRKNLYPDFYDLPEEQRNTILQEIDQDSRLKSSYKEWQESRPQEYWNHHDKPLLFYIFKYKIRLRKFQAQHAIKNNIPSIDRD